MPPLPRYWMLPAILGVAGVVVWAIPGFTIEQYGWVRGQNVSEPWRLLTAHLLHLDARHLGMNLVGLGLVWALAGDAWGSRAWSATLFSAAVVIGVGLHAVPDLDGYVGLSGVLHAMLAFGAVGVWSRWRFGAVLMIAFLAGKAVGEAFIATPVIVEAHWLGTGAGLAAGIMTIFVRRRLQ